MILITFLIPVFNEEKTVVSSINQILSLKFPKAAKMLKDFYDQEHHDSHRAVIRPGQGMDTESGSVYSLEEKKKRRR